MPQGDLDERPGERKAADAARQARQLGIEVEVFSLRTASERIFAQPDGQWVREQRVRGAGAGAGAGARQAFNVAPDVPLAPQISSKDLTGGVVTQSRPGFAVTVADPEKGLVSAEFEIRREGATVASRRTEEVHRSGRARWSLADEADLALTDGSYTVRARGYDGHTSSEWSQETAFVVDAATPRPHDPRAHPLESVWRDEVGEILAVFGTEVTLSAQVESATGEPVRARFHLEQTDEDTPDLVRLGSVVASGERSVVVIDADDLFDGYYRVRISTVSGDVTATDDAPGRQSGVSEIWLRTLSGGAGYDEDAHEAEMEAELEAYEALEGVPTAYPGVDAMWLSDLTEIAVDEGRDLDDVVDWALWEDRYSEVIDLASDHPQFSEVRGEERGRRVDVWFTGDVPPDLAARIAAFGGDTHVHGGAALSATAAEQAREHVYQGGHAVFGDDVKLDLQADSVSGRITGSLGIPQGHRLTFADAVAALERELGEGPLGRSSVTLDLDPMTVSDFRSSVVALPYTGGEEERPAGTLLPARPPVMTGSGTLGRRLSGEVSEGSAAAVDDVLPHTGG
ncbi:hypothetical protein [Nocardioides yefusunii]|uniref:Uncharacterized protein n=1 Tax=Nocardioides yefusunii TaxID=2500546 RepID=A0ABW1QSF7_9ACTN|nr:hypothetical protein [Nocardioides yefusunii]